MWNVKVEACSERVLYHEHILNSHETRLNNHGERLDTLERTTSMFEVRIVL